MEKAGETDDRHVFGPILHQMKGLGDGQIHLPALDLVDRVEVLPGFDEFEVDSGLLKPGLFKSDEEGDVIGIEKLLQAKCQLFH